MSSVSLTSALGVATQGLMNASNRFGQAAQKTAADPTGDNAVSNITDQIEAKHAFSANLKTVHVADQMLKQLLDIKV
jgi:flagellar hook protein FlgE